MMVKGKLFVVMMLIVSIIIGFNVGVSMAGDRNEDAINEVSKLAEFDLNCTKDKMQFTILKEVKTSIGLFPVQIGVKGCNKSVRYVLIEGKWIANTISQ